MLHKMEDPWPRREHFAHYMNNLRCTYSLTVNLDITGLRGALKARSMKAYPAQVYLLASAVNRFVEFRMGLTEAGDAGYWDTLHPAYTVFNPQRETFCSIWTPYEKDFRLFYRAMGEDMARYKDTAEFEPKKGMPPNAFNVSSLPWVDFTAFNLNVYTEGTHLAPIFTLGRYIEQDGKTLLPLAMQLHHAACDGYHAGRFVEAVRTMARDYEAWL